MKSFWIGSAIAVVIAIGAAIVLNATGQSAGEKYSTANVRLH